MRCLSCGVLLSWNPRTTNGQDVYRSHARTHQRKAKQLELPACIPGVRHV